MTNIEKETKYRIYEEDGSVIECADIDDMTDYANSLLYSGCKKLILIITD